MRYRTSCRNVCQIILFGLICFTLSVLPGSAQGLDGPVEIPLIRTDGAGETVASFAELRDALEAAVAAHAAMPSRAGVVQINLLLADLRSLIDLDGVPAAARQRVGNATALALIAVHLSLPGFAGQLMPFSQMPEIVAYTVTLLSFAALAWLFWAAVQSVVALRSTPGPDAPTGR
ncbi:hypothetical protein [Aliiruegeria lutimaris]|uniref:Uncharacterized protein n=1 Tax=Aliiruegeria lutimaris TaxID=571298 RepID=A0A1G9AE28_9RHOB|nr:hypothetical protein [Aliiruegeria lutimaris]SDK25627.1 hypothetical protein SAMN04488026_103526 [Aliiruegeria lutimaris]